MGLAPADLWPPPRRRGRRRTTFAESSRSCRPWSATAVAGPIRLVLETGWWRRWAVGIHEPTPSEIPAVVRQSGTKGGKGGQSSGGASAAETIIESASVSVPNPLGSLRCGEQRGEGGERRRWKDAGQDRRPSKEPRWTGSGEAACRAISDGVRIVDFPDCTTAEHPVQYEPYARRQPSMTPKGAADKGCH